MCRLYLADAVRLLGECAAGFAGGSYLTARLPELLRAPGRTPERGDELARDVIERAGLVMKNGHI